MKELANNNCFILRFEELTGSEQEITETCLSNRNFAEIVQPPFNTKTPTIAGTETITKTVESGDKDVHLGIFSARALTQTRQIETQDADLSLGTQTRTFTRENPDEDPIRRGYRVLSHPFMN